MDFPALCAANPEGVEGGAPLTLPYNVCAEGAPHLSTMLELNHSFGRRENYRYKEPEFAEV
jgi:hypothetical protein